MLKKTIVFLDDVRDRFFEMNSSINNEVTNNSSRPAVLFLSTLFFYIAYQLLMQPGWVLGGEMWAEMGNNYFPNANASSYFQKLFATDAGYIPLPQRLIALVGNLFHLPAASIPYFYTGSAIISTGMMVGAFCLARFRILIPSDSLRFFTVIVILMIADFETRTFISFTYFAAFFVAIITALAWVDDTKEVPWWAWFIPLLMLSKPAVLSVLPAMILVAITSKARFRWITVVTVILCLAQLLQMIISQKIGVMHQTHDMTLLAKIMISFKYFFGFLGAYIFGHGFNFSKDFLVWVGVFTLGVSGLVVFKRSSNAVALIIIGLSLLFFNIFLNVFMLSDMWNENMTRLDGIPVYRHIIIGFFGCILIVSGAICALMPKKNWGTLLFIVWFVWSGWLLSAGKMSREPASPLINNSQWQNMALAIDSGVSPLCVPVDPIGWSYSRNCSFLNPSPHWGHGVSLISDPLYFDVLLPAQLSDKTIVAVAVLVRSLSLEKTFVDVQMTINLVDGRVLRYSTAREMTMSGGLLMLTGKESIAVKNIASVRLIFNVPVEIALAANNTAEPGIMWMGY